MAGVLFERQESGLVDAINNHYALVSKPFTLRAGGTIISQVTSARKVEGRLPNGNEPYPDVEITSNNGKLYKISMKGTSAPSMAGGGLDGLEQTVPGFTGKFLEAALNEYKKRGYKDGDQIPDVYGKVSDKLKQTIVLGTPAIGGPITHLYIGPMNVVATKSASDLVVNGQLHDAKTYARTHSLYLRLRKRRADQPFDSKSRDNRGYPLILGRSPSRGDAGRRIVIVAQPPGNAIVVEF